MSETATHTHTNTNAAPTDRHILAERFKTKLCRHFVDQGFCPYETRCMFAHGDEDLRTAAMNVRDGLFTEEAIKAWKRAQRLVQRPSFTQTAAPCEAPREQPQQMQQQQQPQQQQQQQRSRRSPPQYDSLFNTPTTAAPPSSPNFDGFAPDHNTHALTSSPGMTSEESDLYAQQQQQQYPYQSYHQPFVAGPLDALELMRPSTPEAADSEYEYADDYTNNHHHHDNEDYDAYDSYGNDGSFYHQPQPQYRDEAADRWFSSTTASPVRHYRFNPYNTATAVDFVLPPSAVASTAIAVPAAAKRVALIDSASSNGEAEEVMCP